jgi:hypothetical protein
VVRVAHVTRLARLLAVCLIVFTVSPVTAPFTTCDLTDFIQSHTPDSIAARSTNQTETATVTHLVTFAVEATPKFAPHVDDARAPMLQGRDTLHARHDLRPVLRL